MKIVEERSSYMQPRNTPPRRSFNSNDPISKDHGANGPILLEEVLQRNVGLRKPTDPIFNVGKGMQVVSNDEKSGLIDPSKQLIQERLEGARKNFERSVNTFGEKMGLPTDDLKKIQQNIVQAGQGVKQNISMVGNSLQQVPDWVTLGSDDGQAGYQSTACCSYFD
jgi:hypothetical protein